MSSNSHFLKNTEDLIETSLEVKSFIHQQVAEFQPFITPETLIVVIARDANDIQADAENEEHEESFEKKTFKYRIAIVLKEDESSIEAEGRHDDIYEAIKIAKEILVAQLLEIQSEMETSSDRLVAIQQAGSTNNQIH